MPALEQQFERQRAGLPGSAEPRKRALDQFLAKGFPTRREEAWRYTDLKPIAEGDFDPAPPEPGAAVRERAAALLAEAPPPSSAGRIVLVNGALEPSLSQLDTPAGLEIVRLATDAAAVDRPPRASLDAHPLALLNRAFGRDGVAIRVAAGSEIDAPLELFLFACEDGRIAQHPRISLELERGARLDVLVRCADAGSASGWVNSVIDASLAEGSRLSVHRLQEHGAEVYHTSVLAAEVAKDAALEAGYVDLGARIARNDFDVKLAEPGASADLFGVFLASPGRHADDQVHIEHAAAHTRSDTAFRGIADSGGHGVFRGKLLVRPDAQKIDARQNSDNLLLAEKAEIDTRPELEIYADDVKCSHGATVGELDAEQMFYLRARGLDEDAARAVLTFAFANSLLRRLRPAWLRERATSLVARQLPDRTEWEDLA